MTERTTERGFRINEFTDRNGVKCSLQKSSIATEDRVWLGTHVDSVSAFIPNGNPAWRSVPLLAAAKAALGDRVVMCAVDDRMHLNQEQVRALLPALIHFAETGELPDEEVSDGD